MFGFKNYGNNDTRSGFGVGLVEAASKNKDCLLYTSDAADEGLGVDLGGRRIIKNE